MEGAKSTWASLPPALPLPERLDLAVVDQANPAVLQQHDVARVRVRVEKTVPENLLRVHLHKGLAVST